MARRLVPFENRFWAAVERTDGCWVWQGTLKGNGYGSIFRDGKHRLAHRESYELLVGPIPEGLEIDHLCRNRLCVNPAHLEPVTTRENGRRGFGVGALNAAKTHCPHGHEYTSENTLYKRGRYGKQRLCRICNADRCRDWLASQPPRECSDCGTEIHSTSARCRSCAAKVNRARVLARAT